MKLCCIGIHKYNKWHKTRQGKVTVSNTQDRTTYKVNAKEYERECKNCDAVATKEWVDGYGWRRG